MTAIPAPTRPTSCGSSTPQMPPRRMRLELSGAGSNDEFDTLLGEAYTLDEAVRKEIFCQMAKILDEQVPGS